MEFEVKQKVTSTFNIAYDALTILISIADVTTDIMVLISFYNNGRMTFFAVSLVILILAQCSYSMAFAMRFDTIDKWDFIFALCLFCCMLPCASTVAFCIYLADEDTGCGCCIKLVELFGLRTKNWLKVKNGDSPLTIWIKQKLSKHIGFILEAGIEAFPQSLLQITAIVYYQEANYIAIASILISMFSVMSKSLILSQGIEKLTFVWTWLCLVTDFFGIFFTLTWVFYSHDSIEGNFLGYFNIFGQIWIIKVVIGVAPPIVIGLAVWFLLGFWVAIIAVFLRNSRSKDRIGWLFTLVIFGNLAVLLFAFVVAIGLEVFCFSFLALGLYVLSTQRISGYSKENVSKILSIILNFISSAKIFQKNDRIIRILAVNKAIYNVNDKKCSHIISYMDKQIKDNNGNYDALKHISYSDIRNHCRDPKIAKIFPDLFEDGIEAFSKLKNANYYDEIEHLFNIGAFLAYAIGVWIFMPIAILTKLLQIIYPWIIVVYLISNNLLFSDNRPDTFQLVMLGTYCLLQIILFIIGIFVFRIHRWLWHIEPGKWSVYWGNLAPNVLEHDLTTFYQQVRWTTTIKKLLINEFGSDIGKIIFIYYNHMIVKEDGEESISILEPVCVEMKMD